MSDLARGASLPWQRMCTLLTIKALGLLQQGGPDKKVLLVISDGGDNASTHTLAEPNPGFLRARTTGRLDGGFVDGAVGSHSDAIVHGRWRQHFDLVDRLLHAWDVFDRGFGVALPAVPV